MKKCPYLKKVLITGASSGIGKETAKLFAENGFTVYGISRSVKESTLETKKGVIHYFPADVNNTESLEKVKEKIDELGMIIHCAGFGISGSAEGVPVEDAEDQFKTNFFGVLRVNNIFLPLLRKNQKSLVLLTGSVAGQISIPFQSHYSASKAALYSYTQALRLEGREFGIRASIIEPGDTQTGFTGSRKPKEPEDSPYLNRCLKSVAKMEKDELNGKPADSVSKVFLKMSYRKNPPVHRSVGFVYRFLCGLIKILPTKTAEFLVGKLYL